MSHSRPGVLSVVPVRTEAGEEGGSHTTPEGPVLGLEGPGPWLRGPSVAACGLGAGTLEHSGNPRWRDLVSF